MSKVFVVSSSLRNGSNSELMAKAFVDGAKESGNEVVYQSLKEFNLAFCKGCLACQKIGRCVTDDDVKKIINDIAQSNCLVLATPVYYYGMAGQLKTLLDRLNPLYGKEIKIKEVYLLGACADESLDAFDKTITSLSGWIECFEGVKFKEALLATNTNDANRLSDAFKMKAYELGKRIG